MTTMTLQPISQWIERPARVAKAPAGGAAEMRPGQGVGEVRLTRRGRFVVLVVALMVIFAGGLLLSTTSAATDSSVGFPTRVVMVSPGDTLWAIADDVADGGSTREMVTTIEALNDLAGGGLQAGQRLVVPLR